MVRNSSRIVGGLIIALVPQLAMAHTGVGDTSGFMHGLVHPLKGLDHVLAMVSVGVFAAHLGGRALWLVPASFVLLMVAGGVLGIYGFRVPHVEVGIAASVTVLGLLIASQKILPTAAAIILVGFFAVFHGHAHGAEMPMDVWAAGYGGGFTLATALLHAAGIGLGLGIGYIRGGYGKRVEQVGGAGMALVGIGMLAGIL